MIGLSEIRAAGVKALAEEAVRFLESHSWCGGLKAGELAFALSGVVGVFRLSFRPNAPGVDDVLWVVVGDVPPAYLVLDGAPNWQSALAAYVREMRAWVAAVRAGAPLDDVIPVKAAATPEHAAMLESRLDFIQHNLVDVSAGEVEGDT